VAEQNELIHELQHNLEEFSVRVVLWIVLLCSSRCCCVCEFLLLRS